MSSDIPNSHPAASTRLLRSVVPRLHLAIVAVAAVTGSWLPCAVTGRAEPEGLTATETRIEVVDSRTGFRLRPDSADVRFQPIPDASTVGGHGTPRLRSDTDGLFVVDDLNVGGRFEVRCPGFEPVEVGFPPGIVAGGGRRIRILLDPATNADVSAPRPLSSLPGSNRMTLRGFVSDSRTGLSLPGVEVTVVPGGAAELTLDDGAFSLFVPVPSDPVDPGNVGNRVLNSSAGEGARSISLRFVKHGFKTVEVRDLEMWSGGDWSCPVRMTRQSAGEPEPAVIRVNERRPDGRGEIHPATPAPDGADFRGSANDPAPLVPHDGPPAVESMLESAIPVTVRLPRTIRVLLADGRTVEYVSLETYCRRTLPREWIASWSQFPGGENSLRAGAVAIRTYAAGFVNQPRGLDHDICATTACQVYGDATSASTDAATEATRGRVMIRSGSARVDFKLTEYSAENNALGLACGDGFTSPVDGCLADSICSGETRFGHGRGMCQWGSARWATGLKMEGRRFPLDGRTPSGFPKRDWVWILEHYYPDLTLAQGSALQIGDKVRVEGTTSLAVRECDGGGIAEGVECPQQNRMSAGTTGVIVDGPRFVSRDGRGHTWWRIRWADTEETIGWSAENWLDRVVSRVPGPPVLGALPDRVVREGERLEFDVPATADRGEIRLVDLETDTLADGDSGVLFRTPRFSGTTDGFLAGAPDQARLTGDLPAGNRESRAVLVRMAFLPDANESWLRLTTFDANRFPNPIVDLKRWIQFDVHSDRPVSIGLGVRETQLDAGAIVGSDGGSAGPIEWLGVAHHTGGRPDPLRNVASDRWQSLVFNPASDPITAFAGGDGVLDVGSSGLAVLEHLAVVPRDGAGEYRLFLNNFRLVEPVPLLFSLGRGAPPGATIDTRTGTFRWQPTAGQAPGLYQVEIVVALLEHPEIVAASSFKVRVLEADEPPHLRVSGLDPDAGRLVLEWTALPGRRYLVETTDSAIDPVWRANGPVVTAETDTAAVPILVRPGPGAALFRVRLLDEQ